jgi:hypothetical protein
MGLKKIDRDKYLMSFLMSFLPFLQINRISVTAKIKKWAVIGK